jgi:ATP-binding cassette subfamily B (MDR/TAP) protein 1
VWYQVSKLSLVFISGSNFRVAGLFPGQAVLMANMIQVFTLTGDEMTDLGDFFSAMFVALAGAALFSYFVMGWGTNTLAQVSN